MLKLRKRGIEMTMQTLVTVVAIIIFLFIIIYVFDSNFVKSQLPFLQSNVESQNIDCDGDGDIGIVDDCPCTAQPKDEDGICPDHDFAAQNKCRTRCKVTT